MPSQLAPSNCSNPSRKSKRTQWRKRETMRVAMVKTTRLLRWSISIPTRLDKSRWCKIRRATMVIRCHMCAQLVRVTRTRLRRMRSWWVCWLAWMSRLLRSWIRRRTMSLRKVCKDCWRHTRSWLRQRIQAVLTQTTRRLFATIWRAVARSKVN